MTEIMKDTSQIPVFALEGAAFSGKTTLLNHLHNSYADCVVTIPESSEYVGGDEHFPDTPFQTLEEGKSSTYFFVEIEKRRCEHAYKLHHKYQLPVVLDRTIPISSLFFYKLLKKTGVQAESLANDIYQHALEVFCSQAERGNIFIPSRIIYLKPISKDVFNQRLSRGTKNSVFTQWNSYLYLDHLYHQLFGHHFSDDRVLTLFSDNTTDSLSKLAGETLSFLERDLKHSPVGNIFRHFLGQPTEFRLVENPQIEENQFQVVRNRANILMNDANIEGAKL